VLRVGDTQGAHAAYGTQERDGADRAPDLAS